jgi:hypothetical protein
MYSLSKDVYTNHRFIMCLSASSTVMTTLKCKARIQFLSSYYWNPLSITVDFLRHRRLLSWLISSKLFSNTEISTLSSVVRFYCYHTAFKSSPADIMREIFLNKPRSCSVCCVTQLLIVSIHRVLISSAFSPFEDIFGS